MQAIPTEGVPHLKMGVPHLKMHACRELVGKGETRGTEFKWGRTYLHEPGTGKLIAEMTLQDMMLKGSFEGYAEIRAKSDEMAAATKSNL